MSEIFRQQMTEDKLEDAGVFVVVTKCIFAEKTLGGGGTPLYKLYRYVPPQRVWFLSRFGLKTGKDFDHHGLKSGMVFKGTTGAYKRICLFNSK